MVPMAERAEGTTNVVLIVRIVCVLTSIFVADVVVVSRSLVMNMTRFVRKSCPCFYWLVRPLAERSKVVSSMVQRSPIYRVLARLRRRLLTTVGSVILMTALLSMTRLSLTERMVRLSYLCWAGMSLRAAGVVATARLLWSWWVLVRGWQWCGVV